MGLCTNSRLALADVGVGLLTRVAADVRCAVLKVVEAGHGKIEVQIWAVTEIAVWRATILLHDHRHPTFVHCRICPHQQTLPTTASASIVRATALTVRAKIIRERVRGCACHPKLLTVRGTAIFLWIHWRIVWRKFELTTIPWLKNPSVTPSPIAVPIVRTREASVWEVDRRRGANVNWG